MRLQDWADANRLRWRLDECRDPMVKGKFGHIYEHSDCQLGAFLDHPINSRIGDIAMRNKMRRLDGLGLQNKQRATTEGSWLLPSNFGPQLPIFAPLLKILGIRKIRKATGRPFAKRNDTPSLF
jgi:hypothetical protein